MVSLDALAGVCGLPGGFGVVIRPVRGAGACGRECECEKGDAAPDTGCFIPLVPVILRTIFDLTHGQLSPDCFSYTMVPPRATQHPTQ